MLEVLQFVFSGFWIWLGSVVLLSVAGQAFGAAIGAAAAALAQRGGKG